MPFWSLRAIQQKITGKILPRLKLKYTSLLGMGNIHMPYTRGSQPVLRGALRAPRALPRGSAAAPGK